MTAIDGVPTLGQYAVMRLTMRARKRANQTQGLLASNRITAIVNATVRVVLHIAGFSLLTIAAWHWNMIAGLAVAGISCFVFSALMTGSNSADETEVRRAPDLRTGQR